MAQRLIICAAESRLQANRIVGHLINGGFTEDAVSILFAGNTDSRDSANKKHPASALAARAGVGALLGGAFVWLTGMGILFVPGFGSLVIAGAPLVAMMGRPGRGGVAAMLKKMGLSKPEAVFYEAKIRQGNILISVNVCDSLEAIAAKRVVQAIGSREIADTGEQVAPSAIKGHIHLSGSMLEYSVG